MPLGSVVPLIEICAGLGSWQDNSGIQVSKHNLRAWALQLTSSVLQDCFRGSHPIGTNRGEDETISLMAEMNCCTHAAISPRTKVRCWISSGVWTFRLLDGGERSIWRFKVKENSTRQLLHFWFFCLEVGMSCLNLSSDTQGSRAQEIFGAPVMQYYV